MSDRPDGCYRWVIAFDDGSAPFIAYWCSGRWVSMCDPDDEDGVYVRARVHKVGIGGTLDAPPDVWVDDVPEVPKRAWVQVEADPARWAWQTPTFGTDDPDAGTMTERGLRPLTSEEAEASLGRPLR